MARSDTASSDPVAEIKRLYHETTAATIERDLTQAIEWLKALPGEADRERVAVYMDGLSLMRSEWAAEARKRRRPRPRRGGHKR